MADDQDIQAVCKTKTPMTPDVALVRLHQYQERPAPTWSTASHGNSAAEGTLAEIGRTLAAEVKRLRARAEELTQQRDDLLAEDALAERDRDQQPEGSRPLREAYDRVDEALVAETDHGRASALYEVLLQLGALQPHTCARSGGLHSKNCPRYVPGHELLSQVNGLKAYRRQHTAGIAERGARR